MRCVFLRIYGGIQNITRWVMWGPPNLLCSRYRG